MSSAPDEVVVDQGQVEFVVVLQASHRADRVAAGQGLADVREREPVRLQAGGIDLHLVLGLFPALHHDAGNAGNRRKQGPQLVVGGLPLLNQGQAVGSQTVGEAREYRRIHPPDLKRGAGRQGAQHLIDGRLDLEHRRDHVAAPVEVDRDIAAATAGRRADIAHAGHRPDGLLDRDRHLHRHALGRPVAGVEIDHDPRKIDLGKQRHRQAKGASPSRRGPAARAGRGPNCR